MKSLPVQHTTATTPSTEHVLGLGHRLRALREQRRLTIAQVSQVTDLSKGFISRVERGLVSPSVSSLMAICEVLGVSAGELLDAPDTFLVRFNQAPTVDLGGKGLTERLLTPPTQRGLQLVHATIEPGGSGEVELYTMDCSMESLHLISGEFILITTDQKIHLHPGDTVTFPGSEPHTWRNPREDTPAHVLWILTRYPT